MATTKAQRNRVFPDLDYVSIDTTISFNYHFPSVYNTTALSVNKLPLPYGMFIPMVTVFNPDKTSYDIIQSIHVNNHSLDVDYDINKDDLTELGSSFKNGYITGGRCAYAGFTWFAQLKTDISVFEGSTITYVIRQRRLNFKVEGLRLIYEPIIEQGFGSENDGTSNTFLNPTTFNNNGNSSPPRYTAPNPPNSISQFHPKSDRYYVIAMKKSKYPMGSYQRFNELNSFPFSSDARRFHQGVLYRPYISQPCSYNIINLNSVSSKNLKMMLLDTETGAMSDLSQETFLYTIKRGMVWNGSGFDNQIFRYIRVI